VRVHADVAHVHGTIPRGSQRPGQDMPQQEGPSDNPHAPEPHDDRTDGDPAPTEGSAHGSSAIRGALGHQGRVTMTHRCVNKDWAGALGAANPHIESGSEQVYRLYT
jgi:hypothetical protein